MADKDEKFSQSPSRQGKQESPEAKRSKPLENSGCSGEENRRLQRELMAAAAEKRMLSISKNAVPVVKDVEMEEGEETKKVEADRSCNVAVPVKEVARVEISGLGGSGKGKGVVLESGGKTGIGYSGRGVTQVEADKLFWMVFGSRVSKDVVSQWSNQGIRFSADPETSMGLVQHEGGPCGVLAAVQAFVLKYLLFSSEESDNGLPRGLPKNEYVAEDIFSSLSEEKKSRALVKSMSEILFLCGSNQRAVIASVDVLNEYFLDPVDGSEDEVIAKVLAGLSLESGADFHMVLRIETCTSWSSALQKLEAMLPVFRSRMGVLLFLISALLSRGLDKVQEDRDDPSQPLVTAPFGHASQEIVNLLLSGSAAANVFDGRMDLGGGMFVKGISTNVEVGFLTLLESLNFCKVGQYLKCPRWPIWVVGSESHYSVLFALDTNVQEENELESRESQIRRIFDEEDQSGGGGFISVEGFQKVVQEAGIHFPPEKVEHLCGAGFIVWSEFWQALLDLDKALGGVKDSTGLMGKKVFDLYHFNGIAKSIANGSNQLLFGSESPIQKPRLTKLRVSVPPKWTPEEFMTCAPSASSSSTNQSSGMEDSGEVSKPQHAPLVDCIRTRWARAVCNWDGDGPSIV